MRLSRGVRCGEAGKKGRGVFATKDYAPGALIERAPVIVIPRDDSANSARSFLAQYLYETEDGRLALALGLASLYNHSYSANAEYSVDAKNGNITIVAVRHITSGSEITINYNGEPGDKTKIDFRNWPF